jgi:hypothetical protein
MAVGTITNVAIDPHSASALPTSIGDLKLTVTTVVGSGSYTTGGDALTPANLGLGTVLFASTTLVASSGSNCSAVSARVQRVHEQAAVLLGCGLGWRSGVGDG